MSRAEADGPYGRDFRRAVLGLLAFALLTSIVGSHHEPWFDEAQAWLIGRDCSLWELLAHRVRYEGTPGAWHALLWLLSHVGLPFDKLWLVSTALACVGVWVILRHAPFPFWLRLGIVFSYFVSYQYAVVARSYALDLALIPLVAATFEGRMRRPVLYGALLGILANCNAHSFVIAGLMMCEFLYVAWRTGAWRHRSVQAAVAIFGLLAGAAVLQAWPPSDISFATASSGLRFGLVIREAFIDRFDLWSSEAPLGLSQLIGYWISIVLLVPAFALIWRGKNLVLVLGVFLAFVAFSVVTYANAWHAGMLYLFWILGLWISWKALPMFSPVKAKLIVASIAAIVFVNDVYAVFAWIREVQLPYSAGPAAARVLAAQPAGPIAASGFKTFAVQPWFDKNAFANYQAGAPGVAYYRWRTGEAFKPHADFLTWRELVSGNYKTLVLSTANLDASAVQSYTATATAAGYCDPTLVPGALIWKSYLREDDGMLIFSSCN